jgi:hypothetical protein
MPSVSKKQHNFMAAIAHSPAFAKKVGIPQSVGKDFTAADKGKKFKEGGTMKHDDIKEDKALIKKAFGMHDKQLHESKKTNLTKLKGGGMAKETMGPRTMAMDVEKGSNKLLAHGESAVQKRGHTKGKLLADSGKSLAIQGGAKMCGGGMTKTKKMSSGGSASSRADGIAMKGKTKGKMC